MHKEKILEILKKTKIALYGSNLRTESIKEFLSDLGIDLFLIKDDSVQINLEEIDLCILAGWSKLISSDELSKPKYGFINCHAGKLPEYRGSSPLNWSILNDEKKFGLSVISADKNFDTGEILVFREFDLLDHYEISDLHDIANRNFPQMVIEACLKKVLGLDGYPQPNNGASYFPLRSSEDGEINWYMDDAKKISQKIKALGAPYPGCYCYFKNKKIYLVKTIDIDLNFCGELAKIYKVNKNSILIGTKNGAIFVEYHSKDDLTLKSYEIFDK